MMSATARQSTNTNRNTISSDIWEGAGFLAAIALTVNNSLLPGKCGILLLFLNEKNRKRHGQEGKKDNSETHYAVFNDGFVSDCH